MQNAKRLAALSYLTGIPALYILLTGLRKKEYVGSHAEQALYLWCWFFGVIFLVRFLLDFVWHFWSWSYLSWLEWLVIIVLAGYALRCAYRAWAGIPFKIPH
jgi:uncharacterized membrane protein